LKRAGKCVIVKPNETSTSDHISLTTPFSTRLFIIVQKPCGSDLKHTHTHTHTLLKKSPGSALTHIVSSGCHGCKQTGLIERAGELKPGPVFPVWRWTLRPSNRSRCKREGSFCWTWLCQ